MQAIECTAPIEAREQTYRLLAERSPARVVVDTDLSPGQWYVVRGPYEAESRALGKPVPEEDC